MAEHPLHYKTVEIEEGDGARVRRLCPVAGLRYVDPFVLLDEFFVEHDAGFPDHPHRGFEAISYLFSGAMRHRDNLGNDGEVNEGGVQVFTAGRGIVHSELAVAEGTTHGLQVWVNLARIQKELLPAYQQIDAGQLPTQKLPFGEVRTIVGPGSPIHLHTPVIYQDVRLQHEGEFHATVPDHYVGLVYAVSGRPEVLDEELNEGEALVLTAGTVLTVYAEHDSRFVYLTGKPHGEPIVQNGPYVD